MHKPEALGELTDQKKKRQRKGWHITLITLITVFSTIGLVLVLLGSYLVWIFNADFKGCLEHFDKAYQALPVADSSQDNAWKYYKQATELYVNSDDPKIEIDFSENIAAPGYAERMSAAVAEEEALFRYRVEHNQAARTALIKASSKYGVFPGWKNRDEMIKVCTEGDASLGVIKDLCEQIIWLSERDIAEGKREGIIDSLIAVMNVSKHLKLRYDFGPQLLAIYLQNKTTSVVNQFIREADLEELIYLQSLWQEIFEQGYRKFDISIELAGLLEYVQICFSEGGWGGGRLLPHQLIDKEYVEGPIAAGVLSIVHAGRDETIMKMQELIDLIQTREMQSPYDIRHSTLPSREEWYDKLPPYRFEIVKLTYILPYEHTSHIYYRGKAGYEAMAGIIAVLRWEKEHGDYPDDLGVVVEAGYLSELPDDPYAAGTLIYKRRDDGFVLYSVGMDMVDDGGVENADDYWGEHGSDRVFWPVKP